MREPPSNTLERDATGHDDAWSDGAFFGQPFRIRQLDIYRYQASVEARRSSFGLNSERSALLICLQDTDGFSGWGEVWTGMPAFGATHRAELLAKVVAPKLIGTLVSSPAALRRGLTRDLLPIVRLAGEPGPVAQILAGLDCAVWDLVAQRAKKPLYQLLGGTSRTVKTYASGVSPMVTPEELDQVRCMGFNAFKVKAGFDDDKVLPALSKLASTLHHGENMMIDANCGWDVESALAASRFLADTKLLWMEEPIGPERPDSEWAYLAGQARHPMAAGENMSDPSAFVNAFEWLAVVQPDVGKWGGVSEVLPLAQRAVAAGLMYCPHTFGTHISAAHSAHVLAAVGGDGMLELDVTGNPLRFASEPAVSLADGIGLLGSGSGIGVEMSLERVRPFLCDHVKV